MSRRDTIIVAVLINTGLLGVLFMMALHTDTEIPEVFTHEIVEEVKTVEVAVAPPVVERKQEIAIKNSGPRDEIDQVLEKYSVQTAAPIGVTTQRQDNPNELKLPPSRNLLTKEEPRYVEVTVKRGDYLEKIAKANGTTVSDIKRVNNLSSSRIDIGQVLKIPIQDKQQVKVEKVSAPVIQEPEYYTLKSGDNPWKIAKQYRVGFNELLKMNDLDEDKARNLKPGDVLRVR